ncbi:MAG: carboxylating nicotinate-nucleotide diphosphorylase [Candidatus Omnitrophica bacterium]|nr:carboxylating nicotinate-nucleotide diphosphorylase [Candidatus Omnitrophota bacterium]
MDKKPFQQVIRAALKEDIRSGDVTTNHLVAANRTAKAVIFSKEPAVLCGSNIACETFKILNKNIKCRKLFKDGQVIEPFKPILTLEGSNRAILTGERTALNFLSYLSAIATKTYVFVQGVQPYQCKILDTRKTTPTLRFLERYAVRMGGGHNHRNDLSAMAMIKDNHWVAVNNQPLGVAIGRMRKKSRVPVELEVDDLNQFEEALNWDVDIILLDNMSPKTVTEAVAMKNKMKKKILLEASGGINLSNIQQYAQTGVDMISIGELTHSRSAIDFSLEITECKR